MDAPLPKNVYENLEEAYVRLNHTVVLYEGEPYRVVGITNHRADDIFRVYLWPIENQGPPPSFISNYAIGSPDLGRAFDEYMTGNKETPLLRKMANSPGFNRFRPFPLGMWNATPDVGVYYMERIPARHREQGLTRAHVQITQLSVDQSKNKTMSLQTHLVGSGIRDCIVGKHPTLKECLENLNDPKIANHAAAFHRYMAVLRGPIDLMFLAHKKDIVGYFIDPKKETSVILSKRFEYLKETFQETGLFKSINIGG